MTTNFNSNAYMVSSASFSVFFLLFCISRVVCVCEYENGVAPEAGNCSGPMERAIARYKGSNATQTCGYSEVRYFLDGDTSQPMCGKCIPGTSGAEDSLKLCGLNEYCDDLATCQPLSSHPLRGAPCPWEQGGPTVQGWCGPGLRCIEHVCTPCKDGVLDATDGKICVNEEWTYSKWAIFFREPDNILFSSLLILLSIWMVINIVENYNFQRSKRRLLKLARVSRDKSKEVLVDKLGIQDKVVGVSRRKREYDGNIEEIDIDEY